MAPIRKLSGAFCLTQEGHRGRWAVGVCDSPKEGDGGLRNYEEARADAMGSMVNWLGLRSHGTAPPEYRYKPEEKIQ